jgi:hypothetical protein
MVIKLVANLKEYLGATTFRQRDTLSNYTKLMSIMDKELSSLEEGS